MGKGKYRGGKPGPRTLRFLDRFTLADIRAGKDFQNRISEFHWLMYAELAHQRSLVLDDLHKAILEGAVEGDDFKGWQRVVRFRWSNRPLSMAGSLFSPGGRFNIGNVDKARFPAFPALYLASDKETALSEALGQEAQPGGKLSSYEAALAKPDSVTIVSMSGRVETVVDLARPERLDAFVKLIRGFHLSRDLQRMGRAVAKQLKIAPLNLVRNTKELLAALLAPNWRELPMQLGIPSTSQLFGQLVAQSGVEAIAYPSKFSARPCMAIFPQAFAGGSSHVALDSEPPRKDITTRLTGENWQSLCH